MEVYKKRVAEAQKLMGELGHGLMVLFPSSNMRYLSGFYDEPGERMLFFIMPGEGEPLFLVPELYEQHVRGDTPFQNIHVWRDSDDPLSLLKESLKEFSKGGVSVLVDDRMWAMFLLMLREVLPEASFLLASKVMRPLRMIKTGDEISYLRKAGSVADAAFEEILSLRIEGMRELDLARAIEEAMRHFGAERIAFETLVASGPFSALPHHRAGQRKIARGDVVILDYGCRVGGYCSDITRTVVCGEAAEEVKEIYTIVERAQEDAVKAVKPGVPAQEIDKTARGEIGSAGYEKQFIHRTGHGIGLDVHEEPYLVEGNSLVLEEGMAFSVEPGIYIPGRFGIRIEDIVVVSGEGAQRMNNARRALEVLG